MKNYLSQLLSVLVLSGCAVALKPEAEKVKVMKSDPPSECKDLGVLVSMMNYEGYNRNELRNRAADLGGNYLRIDSVLAEGGKSNRTQLTGTAFKCPN